jgi:hypothetical protein
MGASADAQSVTLNLNQIPAHYHTAGIYDPGHSHVYNYTQAGGNQGGGGAFGFNITTTNTNPSGTGVRLNSTNGLDTTYNQGGGGSHSNMPNTQVAGIWVIKT